MSNNSEVYLKSYRQKQGELKKMFITHAVMSTYKKTCAQFIFYLSAITIKYAVIIGVEMIVIRIVEHLMIYDH